MQTIQETQLVEPIDTQFLVDAKTKTTIPLKSTRFDVDITQGYADMVLHQVYENQNEHPLETLFMIPYSETFILHKIVADFVLHDGTTQTLETVVEKRDKAVQ